MNGRRARATRKERRQRAAERALLPPDVNDRLRTLAKDRDSKLGKLATEYDKRLKALLLEHAAARKKIWDEYTDRCNVIYRAKERRKAA